ncbi:MAG: CotH kinase family protein [Bacteroidaceae bacterium]|nr:CotH kinase family protein [Bacteroidaceae bacterium]
MNNSKKVFLCLCMAMCCIVSAWGQMKQLSGTPIGSPSVDYGSGDNVPANVFDGDYDTYYASQERSYTWVGLDLGEPYVIGKICYAPRTGYTSRMLLGVFEGANEPDFSDAIPFHIIDKEPPEGRMTFIDIACSRGFRYVRYVGPNNVRCNVSELRFYGSAGEGDDTALWTASDLPLITIHTTDAREVTSRTTYIDGTYSAIYSTKIDGSPARSSGGTRIQSDTLQIRGRGNASWGFPKKPYRLKLNRARKLMGMSADAKNWTLINNYGDKTLMRNLLAFDVSCRLGMAWTPEGRLVDVFFNGEYEGTYQLCDQVQVHEDRVAVTKMEKTDNYGDFVTGGYLIELDSYASGEPKWFTSSTFRIPITIKYPDSENITPYQEAYIKNQWNAFERTVSSSNYADPETGYASMLDVPSFVQYFLVGEYSGNTDTYWSVNVWKERDDPRFHFGPVWDFDLAFENDNRTYPISSIGNTFIALSSRSSAANGVRSLIPRIINTTKDLQCEEWSRARLDRGLSTEQMLHLVDSLAEKADVSQRLNFIRWPILSTYVHQNFQALGSYRAEVESMKSYISYRMDWMDKKVGLDSIYSKVILPISNVAKGNVRSGVGGILLEGWPEGTKVTISDVAGGLLTRLVVDDFFVTVPLPSGICVVNLATPDGSIHHVKAYVR